MQGIELLYVVLAVAFAVPIVIMWRTRMIRIEARIEVPAEEPASVELPGSVRSAQPPAAWTVSDPEAPGQLLQPVRAGSLRPLRVPSQRPVTVSDGSPKHVSFQLREPLPLPVRGGAIGFSSRTNSQRASRESPLPLPVPLSSPVGLRNPSDEPENDER